MNKERLGSASTPEEAGETAPDKKPMSETEMLQLMAEKTEYGYPATRYRTMHPDEVDPSDFAEMSDEEFNDHLVALDIILDCRAISRGARPLSSRMS
mgnify:CR=1 FL=1